MSFLLLFKDELLGFYKSKVMIFLWIGLPALAVLFHLWAPNTGPQLPFTVISALLVSSIGGTLASAMLAVTIITEKTSHVYDLFLIRPLKRWNIVLSKFFAVYLCLVIASTLALLLGMAIDTFSTGLPSGVVLNSALQSLALSLSMIMVSSSAGVLIGVGSPSVLVGVILVIYGGNQISVIPLLPSVLTVPYPDFITVFIGVVISCVLLGIAIFVFNKKQF
jgi:ABC-2 type transport system permease protein